MANKVYANMMEVSCKAASGKSICAFPDVCFTPPQTPATPPGVPIPYPNTGMASDTTNGSTTVKISGQEVMLKNKSYFKKSMGDEAGVAPKKGVVTSKNMGKVYFNAWSMDVKVEGENVVRHFDLTTHNHASPPGNTPPMAYTDSMAPSGGGGASECAVCAAVGSPIDPVLGAKALSGPEDLDFVLPGPLPLDWQRSYLSINRLDGWFGRGWRSPLEISIEAAAAGGIDYLDKYGRRTHFPRVARGASFYSAYEQLTLSRDQDGRYCVRGADGLSFHFEGAAEDGFDLARLSDRNGNFIAIERSGAGTLYLHCSGRQLLELGFDGHGRLVEIVEWRGVGPGGPASQRMAVAAKLERVLLMQYRYNGQHDLAEVLDRHGGCVRRFDWEAHLMVRQVYADAFEAFYEYVRHGDHFRVLRHWDNVGRSWTFRYGVSRTDVTDQDGIVTAYHFDERQRLTAYTDGLGQVTRRGLDRYGNLRALIDPANNVTETEYDEWSNPVAIRDATGATSQMRWDPVHAQPMEIVDPLGRATTYEYDARGNLVAETDASGARTVYQHDDRGLATAIEDANGGVSRFEYDPRGLVTAHTDCSGQRTAFAYNADGWLVEVTDALGQSTRYVRDAFGRIRRQMLPCGSSTSYEYEPAGRVSMEADGLGNATRYRYTPDGLMESRTDALGHSMKYRFDSARRLVEIENQVGAHYRFVYDAADRLIEETRFDGTQTRYHHDPAGFVVESTECPGTGAEIHSHFKRDGVGRLLERIAGQNQSAFVYDPAGQLLLATNLQSRVEMQYDAAGRLIAETTVAQGRSLAVMHAYDALGNVVRTTLPDGRALDWLRYGSGHIHRVSLDGKLVCDIERDALHREIERTQGRLTMLRQYDPMSRLARQTSAPVPDPGAGIQAAGPTSRIDRRVGYDTLGRVESIVEGARKRVFGYDALGRLTRCDAERFAFDAADNVVDDGGASRGVQTGRLLEIDDKRYRYDAHGRVVEKEIGPSTVLSLAWDDEHRLSQSTSFRGGVGDTVHYLYDAFGRRIAKQGSQGLTRFVWDHDRLLQEYGPSSRCCTYVYESDGFVPLAQEVMREGESAALFHYHCDQIGLPRELTAEDGVPVWRAECSAWGQVHQEEGPGDATAPLPTQPLRFQGQYEDAETGLHYNRHRYYDPDARGYLSPDPIGLLGGPNLYRYVNDPLSFADPLGLMPAAGNVADSQIKEDYGRYSSEVKLKGGTPDSNCVWLEKNKGKYRSDQVKPTEKAWGCKGSRHCKGGKKK